MSMEQQQTSSASAATKKHTRSRGRAKQRAQDPYDSVYGIVPWEMFGCGRPSVNLGKLDEAMVGKYVVVFGRVLWFGPVSKTSATVVLLNTSITVNCMIVAGADEGVTTRMVRFAATMRRGTVIDVEGVVSRAGSAAQDAEIIVRKLHTIGRLKDGSRQDACSIVASRPLRTIEQQQTSSASAATKKHSRSRGRAKRAQDPYDSVYGIVPWEMFGCGRPSVNLGKLDDEAMVGKYVVVFGRVLWFGPVSKTSATVVLLNTSISVNCMIVAGADEGVTTRMVRFAATMRRGTVIDVEGVVSRARSAAHDAEIIVRKLHTIGRLKDGSRQNACSIGIVSRPE